MDVMSLPSSRQKDVLDGLSATLQDFNCDLLHHSSTEILQQHHQPADMMAKLKEEQQEPSVLSYTSSSSYRSRCNTWPRQQLLTESHNVAQRLLSGNGGYVQEQQLSASSGASSCSNQEEDATSLPLITVASKLPPVTEVKTLERDKKSNNPCNKLSSPSQQRPKTSSRRNPWGNLSYADLITQAIQSAPDQRLTLAQIYEWLVKNVSYFSGKGDSVSSIGWKNSIRHNLSLHSRFVRVQNEGSGKSSWWMLNPEANSPPSSSSSPSKHTSSTASVTAASAKHSRRRANTLDTPRFEQRRKGRVAAAAAAAARRAGTKLKRAVSSSSVMSDTLDVNGEIALGESLRPRTSSNASSCGGRISPFRSRTLSNASADHNTPPNEFSLDGGGAVPSWGNGHMSPLNQQQQQQHHHQQQQQQHQHQHQRQLGSDQDQALREEDLECLKLLDLSLDAESSQMLLDALCSEAANGDEADVTETIGSFAMGDGSAFKDDKDFADELKVAEEAIKNAEEQMQQQQAAVHLGGNVTNGHKITILEQRDARPLPSSGKFVDGATSEQENLFAELSQSLNVTPQQHLLQRELFFRNLNEQRQQRRRQIQCIQEHQFRQQDLYHQRRSHPDSCYVTERNLLLEERQPQQPQQVLYQPPPPSFVLPPLTTVSESANEDGSACLEFFGAGANDDDKDMQTLVDPLTVGGFSSFPTNTIRNSGSSSVAATNGTGLTLGMF